MAHTKTTPDRIRQLHEQLLVRCGLSCNEMNRPEARGQAIERAFNSTLEIIDVDLDVLGPFFREVFFRVDGLDGAFVDAEAAVDAGVWIDVELVSFFEAAFILGWMDAIHGTDLNA